MSTPVVPPASSTDRTAWMRESRLGLFVHFGPYSVAGRHEWVMSRERLTRDQYRAYVDAFDPDLFDARELARAAREAGAGYVVLTTKHHDGFCLWDSDATDDTATRQFGRDLVREYVDALREEGLRVGFYYSLLDWVHPDYTIDCFHPLRDREDVAQLNAGRDMQRYRAYVREQLTELLTRYGEIDYLFFDFTKEGPDGGLPGKSSDDWRGEEILELCRSLQPAMVVNDRLGIPGDLITPEQYQPTVPPMLDGVPVMWEACQTLNGSWGYDRDNTAYKSPDLIVRMIARSVSLGGNVLLNIGPDGRGRIRPRERAILDAVGQWMAINAPAIDGAGPSDRAAPRGTVITQRDGRLYVHLLEWPFGRLDLEDLAGSVRFARFLDDGAELATRVIPPDQKASNATPPGPAAGTLTVDVPVRPPDTPLAVIELVLRSESSEP